MNVAFTGLGQMGGPMCDRVLAAGHTVAVFDPYPAAIAPRVDAGARAAKSGADAASGADAIFVVVRDDTQAIESITSTSGVLAGARAGSIVVLHSTVAPSTVRHVEAACHARGVRFLDAGISGGETGAVAGSLYVMCGGDPADLAAVRPLFDCYAAHVVRFGPVGAGMAAKLARNLMHYTLWTGVHEGMALAEAAGIDLEAFAHLCRESGVFASLELQLARATTAAIDPAGSPDESAVIARIVTLGWKDLDDAMLLAGEVGADVSLARVARQRYGASMRLPLVPPD